MGERPDELRRDTLGESRRETDPLADPAGGPKEVRTPVGPDPALGGGVGGGAVIDEEEANRVELERTRTEIERTRADMSETVDAIQERLSPENLKEQTKDRVKEATVGRAQEAGSGIAETIRANPLPAALTGIGLGWLLVSAIRGDSERARYGERTYAYDYPATYDYPPHHGERTTNGPSAGDALGGARNRVGESATQAQDRAAEVAGRAQDRVGDLADQARYQSRRASGGFQRMLRENPLSVGALAVGVGTAVGLAIPESAKEHEVMGEARDNLVEKAQEKAQEAQQKVQRVAEEAQSAAKEEASNQGLTDQ